MNGTLGGFRSCEASVLELLLQTKIQPPTKRKFAYSRNNMGTQQTIPRVLYITQIIYVVYDSRCVRITRFRAGENLSFGGNILLHGRGKNVLISYDFDGIEIRYEFLCMSFFLGTVHGCFDGLIDQKIAGFVDVFLNAMVGGIPC